MLPSQIRHHRLKDAGDQRPNTWQQRYHESRNGDDHDVPPTILAVQCEVQPGVGLRGFRLLVQVLEALRQAHVAHGRGLATPADRGRFV